MVLSPDHEMSPATALCKMKYSGKRWIRGFDKSNAVHSLSLRPLVRDQDGDRRKNSKAVT